MSCPRLPLLDRVWAVYAAGHHEIEMRSPSRSVRLSGADVGKILPAVLPMLDGRHSVEEISEMCAGQDREAVAGLLSRLFAHGLLVDAEGGRAAPLAGADADLGEGPGIVVAGDGLLARAFCRIATETPVAVRSLGAASEQVRSPGCFAAAAGAALLVAFGPSAYHETFGQANAFSLATGTPWLPVVADGVEASLGPLVLPGRSACLTCLTTRVDALARGPVRLLRAGSSAMLPGAVDVVAGTAAAEAVRFVVGKGRSALVDRVVRIHLGTLEWTRADVLRLPRCPDCAGALPAACKEGVLCCEP